MPIRAGSRATRLSDWEGPQLEKITGAKAAGKPLHDGGLCMALTEGPRPVPGRLSSPERNALGRVELQRVFWDVFPTRTADGLPDCQK
jgi:hypothetical protein